MSKFLAFLQKLDADVDKAATIAEGAASVIAAFPGGAEINAAVQAIKAVADKL